MGLVARALELNGVATTLTSWHPGRTRPTMPPRATCTRLARGATIGQPGNVAQQRRVLRATLDLFSQAGPIDPVQLDEQYAEA